MITITPASNYDQFQLRLIGFVFATLAVAGSAHALEVEGYTEPFREINVAADETGTIEEVFVQEGQAVKAGQPLVRLNSEIHLALLAIADQNMQAEGRLEGAKAELRMLSERLLKLNSLRVDGYARQEEVDRAEMEVAVAKANFHTVQEELVTRRLEYEKIKTQIARRTIRAPVTGVVTILHKERGEFVAPNSPDVLTLVQVDTLLANFTLSGSQAKQFRVGQQIDLQFLSSALNATGTLEFISPVTDAESGTVLVKVLVANPDGRFRSGERCKIRLEN